MTITPTRTAGATSAATAAAQAGRGATFRLLIGGAAAAPLYAVAVLGQAATRDGYDITRHPASVLANGPGGWIQIATFLVTGALMLAAAAGTRRVLRTGPGSVWGPRLLAVQGVGIITAGVFRMDPTDGFPRGTPAGTPTTLSWPATVHNLAGTLAFLAMIAACFVLARRATRGWATAGRICGGLFAAGLIWCYSGGTDGALTLFLGVVTAWTWLSATAAGLAHTPTPTTTTTTTTT
jgi:hypothetical protein